MTQASHSPTPDSPSPNESDLRSSIPLNLSDAERYALQRRPEFEACHERAQFQEAAIIAADIDQAFRESTRSGPIYIANLCNLAVSLALSGEPDKAKEYASNAVIGVHEAGGAQSPWFILTLNNLSMILLDTDQTDAALKTIQGVLDEERTPEQEKRLATELSIAFSTLSAIYHHQEKIPEAIEALQSGISLLKHHPRDNERYQRILGDRLLLLAELYCEQNMIEDSLPLFEEGLPLTRQDLELSHIRLVPSLEAYSYALLLSRDFEGAIKASQEAITIIEKELGENDPLLFEFLVYQAIGEAFCSSGKEREPLLRAHHLAIIFHDEPSTHGYIGTIGSALTPESEADFVEPIQRLFRLLDEGDSLI